MFERGLSLLLLGLLIASPGLWKASNVFPYTALEMRQAGAWAKLGADTVPKFILRCEVKDPQCRSALNARLERRMGYYSYFAAAGAPFGLAGIVLLGLTLRRRPLYSARFARLSDVRDFVIKDKDEFAIPLARLNGKTLGIKHNPEKGQQFKHVEIVAPTQSGKSVHVKSVLGSYQGSGVVVDIKGELLRDTGSYRKDVGEVFVLNPRTCVQRYNPFSDMGQDTTSLRAAAELLIQDPNDPDPVFANRAVPAFVAALRAAQLYEQPPLTYIDSLVAGGAIHFIDQLAATPDKVVRRNLINYLGTTPEEFDFEQLNDARGFLASAWNTMLGRLQPFFEPAILEMMSRSDFRAADLANRPTTLYLSWPEDLLQSNARPLSLILNGLITGMCRSFDRGARPNVPTALILDEATQYRVPALPRYVTTMLGRQICALLYVQDNAQLSVAYGRSAPVIISNCKAKMYIAPSGETAKSLSEALGHVSAKVTTRHVGKGRTVGHFKRELMTADELNTQLGRDEVILSIDGYHTVRGKRLEWFSDRKLKRRLAGPPLDIPGVTVGL